MTKLPTGRHTQTIKSSKKDKERYLQNKSLRSRTKTYVRKVNDAIASQKTEEAEKLMPEIARYADKAASKGAIHKKKASRLKSRLNKKLNRGQVVR